MDDKRCDIIIPIWNQPDFTKDCIESILKNTGYPYRLILIDNASDEETKNYLEALKGSGRAEIELIRNEENLGFVKAVNQGLKVSSAPYICVMNNDTLATKGWLEIMIGVAERSSDIGIANPSSNNLGQRPAGGEPIELYADRLRNGNEDNLAELGAGIGFCMLIKKELIERIGLFDEVYGMGNFEDTDFSRRAVKEGYRCVRACGAYVYHRENSSFKRLKSFDDDFKRNREIYEFRWGRPKRIAYVLDLYDSNILKRLEISSLKLARDGNWVWYFSKERVLLPEHSNIIGVELGAKNFYPAAAFNILKKKKKFNEIVVGGQAFGKFLEALAFIHKARVAYY